MSRKSGTPLIHYIIIIGVVGFLFIKAFVEPAIINAACSSIIICEGEYIHDE